MNTALRLISLFACLSAMLSAEDYAASAGDWVIYARSGSISNMVILDETLSLKGFIGVSNGQLYQWNRDKNKEIGIFVEISLAPFAIIWHRTSLGNSATIFNQDGVLMKSLDTTRQGGIFDEKTGGSLALFQCAKPLRAPESTDVMQSIKTKEMYEEYAFRASDDIYVLYSEDGDKKQILTLNQQLYVLSYSESVGGSYVSNLTITSPATWHHMISIDLNHGSMIVTPSTAGRSLALVKDGKEILPTDDVESALTKEGKILFVKTKKSKLDLIKNIDRKSLLEIGQERIKSEP